MIAGGATVGFGTLFARTAHAVGFGPLLEDTSGVIDLPAGFKYQILQSEGDPMSDGNEVRGAPDGMAAFSGSKPSEIILMRNHERTENGGVSRLVLDASDPEQLVVTSSNDVLGDTSRNCAGGPSPWGWLSCEEVETGGVWLCPRDSASLLQGDERRRIDDYGTFNHEAVAIDPDTLIAYLTEDDGDGYLYRMVPHAAATDPFSSTLQAMKRVGVDDFDTSEMSPGDSIEVGWVDVTPGTAHAHAAAAKASVVARGEGIWWFDGIAYFTASSNGQVFELTPNAENTGGTLRLLANTLDAPDNITVAPWGDLFVAEDSDTLCHIRIVDGVGSVIDFARNHIEPEGEFAGVCFSPDGKILFVNMQSVGLTLAITGPFPDVGDPAGAGGAGGAGAGSGGSSAGGATAGNAGSTTSAGTSAGGAPTASGGGPAVSAGSGGSATIAGGGAASPAAGPAEGCGCSLPGAELGSVRGALGAGALAALAIARRAASNEGSADG